MSNAPLLAGVIGAPIGHSRSPQLHTHWLRQLGIRGHYIPMEVQASDLEEVLRMLPRMGFRGVNVTIPHKERVLEIADQATDRATLMGAANTIIFRADGKLHADNTDGYGFLANLKQQAPMWEPDAGPALVLGAGGASRAVIAALLDAGVQDVVITNRTRIRADQLSDAFGKRVRVAEWVQAGNLMETATTVINTTALGMVGKPEMRVPLDGLRENTVVSDLVYTPLDTRLLTVAAERGCHCVDGLGMLLHQAVPAFERFFGMRPTVDEATRRAALA
ncbi:shikimate dehydrogenase [Pseudaestuariivita sp.]|uniref:shikimate dehydrogenase n=1 Tax=Pseudaestuariivita sp. TaxID=2211669 RepID=UPI0040593E6F